MKPVLDTNVLIDYLSGRDEARAELTKYRTACISVVTWMEVLIGAYGSAKSIGAVLITRNTKDFDPDLPDIRVPYTI